jgi:hypothetical protein
MKYSKRDLRAFDIFALLMFGIGALFFTMGGIRYFTQPNIRVAVISKNKSMGSEVVVASKSGDTKGTVETRNWPAVRTGLLGFVFVALGTAMNIGLRRVARNGDEDASTASRDETAT